MAKIKAFINFLGDTKVEMKKVRWLKRKELVKNTLIVLTVVVVFSLFFAGIDWLIAQALSVF